MNCPKCSTEMEIKDVLTCRTTSPEQEDTFEEMYVCEKCDSILPIISSVEDCEELDEIGDEYGI